ncbi:MAG: hypothetical protein AABY22_08195 [Nanoarchaeota archaeon]
MSNITLSIPNEIHEIIRKHREIRWSEIARKAILEEINKLAVMDKIASKSKLTIKDIEEINEKIKKGLYTKLKE